MSGHARSTVVSLDAYARKPSAEDLQDISQPIGQINFARLLMREWIGLPDDQFKLIFFIFGKTIAWGRKGEYLTYRMMANGDHASRGGGKSERMLRYTLTALEAAGVITVCRKHQATKGLFISINFEWTPEERMLPVSKKRQKAMENETQTSSVFDENDGWADETPAMDCRTPRQPVAAPPGSGLPDIKARPLQQDLSKHDFNSPNDASHRPVEYSPTAFDPASGWEEVEPPALPQKTSSTPIAPPPSSTSVDDLMVAAMAKTHKRLAAAEQKLQPGAMEVTFRAAFAETFGTVPGATFPNWTKADMGRVKSGFLKRWRGTPQEAHELVHWSVTNWSLLCVTAFGWMKKMKPPEFPTLGFFLRWQENFLIEYGRDQTEAWVKSMRDFEQREFARLTIKEGMPPEAARMKIAKDQAVAAMRDENRKTKESANAALRKARLVEDRISRSSGQRPVHPQSAAARDARIQEEADRAAKYREENNIQPLGPDDPIPDLMAAAELGWQNGGWSK